MDYSKYIEEVKAKGQRSMGNGAGKK